MSLPTSIRVINALPEVEKIAAYRTLLPDWVLTMFDIDPLTLTAARQRVVQFRFPEGSRALEVSVYQRAGDRDPLLYLHMADTFNNQVQVLFAAVNDPTAPRFDIDIDEHGSSTQYGTLKRNLPAELAALRAGLAPGQVRAGLRVFRQLVPVFEAFVSQMQHDLFLIEPQSYHNAISFERYGFNYVRGKQDMARIHAEFQPDGALHQQLTPANPFRPLDAWLSVRGRSWAIHDGILGLPFTNVQMVKRIGIDAGVNTFPNSVW